MNSPQRTQKNYEEQVTITRVHTQSRSLRRTNYQCHPRTTIISPSHCATTSCRTSTSYLTIHPSVVIPTQGGPTITTSCTKTTITTPCEPVTIRPNTYLPESTNHRTTPSCITTTPLSTLGITSTTIFVNGTIRTTSTNEQNT